MNKHDKEITDAYANSPVVKNGGYSKKLLERLVPELENDPEHPDIPYLVTFEIRAKNIKDAVEFAKELVGVRTVESVVQKHRTTNVGTEWHGGPMIPCGNPVEVLPGKRMGCTRLQGHEGPCYI